jgi:NhaP-type Na+/H+ or K+/H+ antiporter
MNSLIIIISIIALIIFWIYGAILLYHLKKYSIPQDQNRFIALIYIIGGITLSVALLVITFIKF